MQSMAGPAHTGQLKRTIVCNMNTEAAAKRAVHTTCLATYKARPQEPREGTATAN